MCTNYVVPTPESIASLLSMIFGEALDVSKCDTPVLDDRHAATFIDDEDHLVGLCICDKQFVAYSGAALSMIPADVAKDMINGNDVPEAMVGNFGEVMNICSKLMMSESSKHLRLGKTLSPGASADALASLQESAEISAFGVDIPKYGKGTLTFVVT